MNKEGLNSKPNKIMVILLTLTVFSFLITIGQKTLSQTQNSLPNDLDYLPAQGEISEYTNLNPADENNLDISSSNYNFLLPITFGFIFTVYAGYHLFLGKKGNNKNQSLSPEEERDLTRKTHLQELSEIIHHFQEKNKRYPSKEEFEILRGREAPEILDPLEGQNRQSGGKFSYNYKTIIDPGSGKINSFHLWCFLENNQEEKFYIDS